MATNRVQLLDDNTANQIAAGEVVERPASAVKELVENAVDAGARHITVLLEEGGRKRISVADDGCGMTRADAMLSLQRHATSKIRSADDLFAIRTLGFRGEALPSIASISQFSLLTKPSDEESGTEIRISGGDILDVAEVASRDGTTIEVQNLFFNTPPRLKFLKTTSTETARCIEVVGQLAIAHPNIAFRVRHGNADAINTPGTGDYLSAIAAVWGRDIAKKLIPIEFESGELQVLGFVATPDMNRGGRSHELFYVNRRPIKSRLLSHAIEEAFRAFTPESRYPIGVIFVEINPDMVDVNVHPTKSEVKFTRDGEVHHAVSQAIKSALLAFGIVPTARVTVVQPEETTEMLDAPPRQFQLALPAEPKPAPPPLISGQWDTPSTPNFPTSPPPSTPPSPFEGIISQAVEQFEATTEMPPAQAIVEEEPLLTPPQRPKPFAEQLREFQVLGQARNTYIIALTPNGIAVVDQHVAHERVLYEYLTEKRFAQGIPVQRLVIPHTLNLSKREALLLTEQCANFAKSGWEIEPFGGESFVVRAIPATLVTKKWEEILREMVDELVNHTISRRLLVQQDHVTITNACKLAVKAGDPLTLEEMRGLLEQLADTENPYLCPHGRPIVVTISFKELDKQFKRT
jgi:DNA mismatch repair protein MutL